MNWRLRMKRYLGTAALGLVVYVVLSFAINGRLV